MISSTRRCYRHISRALASFPLSFCRKDKCKFPVFPETAYCKVNSKKSEHLRKVMTPTGSAIKDESLQEDRWVVLRRKKGEK
jgi:hypothetical protein